MRTISQCLRSLANRPVVSEWTDENCDAHEVAYGWLRARELTEFGLEEFYNMTDEEWGMFLYFVSYALETQ